MERLGATFEHLWRHPLVRIGGWICLMAVFGGLQLRWRWRRLRAWMS